MTPNDGIGSLAEVAIKRITVVGSNQGGAFDCRNCPIGTASTFSSLMCHECPVGTEVGENGTKCVPCKEGWFNNVEKSKCKKCPPFTNSQRHETDAPIWKKDQESEEVV